MTQRILQLILLAIVLTACTQSSVTPTTNPSPTPTVSITSPGTGSTTSVQTFMVNGTATASTGATLSSLSYTHNGSNQSLALLGNGSFSFSVTLASGYNFIQVVARDSAGKEAKSDIAVTYTPDPNNPGPDPTTGSFSLMTSYPNGSNYLIARGADALYKVTINNRSNFSTSASSFDSMTATGSIIGTTSDTVRLEFLKDQSSGDELYFALVAGSSVPVGNYSVTITAQGGGVSGNVPVSVQILACSFGCN
jgi:hypothetical protein